MMPLVLNALYNVTTGYDNVGMGNADNDSNNIQDLETQLLVMNQVK